MNKKTNGASSADQSEKRHLFKTRNIEGNEPMKKSYINSNENVNKKKPE